MDLTITHCAADGELLQRASMPLSRMSAKWLAVCRELLAAGPILNTRLQGPLADWRVRCTWGKCQFSIGDDLVFVAAILPENNQVQNDQLLSVLRKDSVWRDILQHLDEARPALVIANFFPLAVTDELNEAMFQLAYHFAAAYCLWMEAS